MSKNKEPYMITCPKCNAQIDLDEYKGRLTSDCPFCNAKGIIDEDPIVIKERIKAKRKEDEAKRQEEKDKRFIKGIKKYFIGCGIFLVLSILLLSYNDNKPQLPRALSEYEDESLEFTKNNLYEAGFRNIKSEDNHPEYTGSSEHNENSIATVRSVAVGGKEDLKKNTEVHYKTPITIYYTYFLDLPKTANDYKGKDYKIALEDIRSAGFKNVSTEKIILSNGLFTNAWTHGQDELASIYVNGEEWNYKNGSSCWEGIEIIIKYYSWPEQDKDN